MKVALVQSPSWSENSPPYASALLAACLKEASHSVACFDLNIKFYNYLIGLGAGASWGTSGGSNAWLEENYVINLIEKHETFVGSLVSQILDSQASIIGFSVQDTSRIFSEVIASRIKEKDRNKIIIFGGPSCFKNSVYYTDFLKRPYIDAICLQEGESAFSDFIDKFEKNGEISFCPGFAYRDKTGNIINCGDRELERDLNSLAFADFSGFTLKEYAKNTLPLSTSRGCLFRCAFCNEAPVWESYRNRSARNIYDEITYQLKKYPMIENFFFNDSLINGNIRMLDELSDLIIKNKLKIRWGGQARIREEMNFKFLRKMRQSGFLHVSYGLESASPMILERMHKKINLGNAEEVIRNTHRAGIRVTVNIVVGFPGETEKEIFETANFLKRNINYLDDIYFHSLVLMPGSYLYEHRGALGIVLPEENRLNLWHSLDKVNNYQIRLERVEFYRETLKEKFASNISIFNYYIALGDQYYGKGEAKESLKFYLKARSQANRDIYKIQLVAEKIRLAEIMREEANFQKA